ncbi:hypothetical protein [Cupriavidus pauculus]|uniref:hypothetical protein n=1 Tax=Cupriavidus pauculus TaxID=82633 RepID=UPI001D0CA0C0|nr:hypothetical protein [Cupriavidus pauculus]
MQTKSKVTRTEVFHRAAGDVAVRVIHAVPAGKLVCEFEVEGEIEGNEIRIGVEPSQARAIDAAIAWLENETKGQP